MKWTYDEEGLPGMLVWFPCSLGIPGVKTNAI